MVCNSCPVQWECADYAVQGKARAGTWAMGITNLVWLQDQDAPLDLIDAARRRQLPLDPYVTDLRRQSY